MGENSAEEERGGRGRGGYEGVSGGGKEFGGEVMMSERRWAKYCKYHECRVLLELTLS